MKPVTFLLAALPAALGTPAPAPEPAPVEPRYVNSTCNPYTDWGHTQGAVGYYCANMATDWWATPDYHCVRYKSADYCAGKAYCSASNPCPGDGICRWGICMDLVNGKACGRTCTYVCPSPIFFLFPLGYRVWFGVQD